MPAYFKWITLIIALALLSGGLMTGCKNNEDEPLDKAFKLSNDILEDPLMRNLEEMEKALLEMDLPSESPQNEQQQTLNPVESEQVELVQPPTDTAPEPALPIAEAVTDNPTMEGTETASDAPVPGQQDNQSARKIYYGIVRRIGPQRISLQIIEAKNGSAEEAKAAKAGGQALRTLITTEVKTFELAEGMTVEKLKGASTLSAERADLTVGQVVRATLTKEGMVRSIRIVREP